jgi:hypothetical protein
VAIAIGSFVDGGNNGDVTNNLTFAFNNVAGDYMRVGFVGDLPGGVDDVSSVTYNGVAMTLIDKISGDRWLYLYDLVAPATGSNNVVITCGSSHYILAGAVSYTGCKNSGQPDNKWESATPGTDTTLTTSLTPVADNCWMNLVNNGYDGGGAPGAGTGSTRRVYDATFGTWGFFDSNGPITPAASYSMTTTYASSSAITHEMASIAPSTAVADNVYRVQPGVVLQAMKRGAFF